MPSEDKVFIGLPWYKATHPLTAFSVMGLIDRQRVAVSMNYGDAFIIHSRNTLAKKFLESSFSWLLMIDDDMLVPIGDPNWYHAHISKNVPLPFAGFHTLDRLLSHGKTIVGALYVTRSPNRKPVFSEGQELNEYIKEAPRDEIRPVRWVGTGCILIHRTVFEDIVKKYPFLDGQWFSPAEHDLISAYNESIDIIKGPGTPGEKLQRLAAELVKAKRLAKVNSGFGMGEDVQFGIRAAQCGHVSHVDLGCICGHAGNLVYSPY